MVVSDSRFGSVGMHRADNPATDSLELIQLHAQAHNALSTALHCLAQPECTPLHLKVATGRALRAATLLKRACAATTGGAA